LSLRLISVDWVSVTAEVGLGNRIKRVVRFRNEVSEIRASM
jgi:hypothetical protein